MERCWPRKEMARSERERKIQAFAESQGWTAAILESAFGTEGNFSAGWNLVKLDAPAANPKKFAADARRDGKELHLHSDKKLTAFVELEPAILGLRACETFLE